MSQEHAQAQEDPQTHLAAEPETSELEEIDAVGPEVDSTDPDAERETMPKPGAHGSGPAGPQQENAETSLDQPSEDVE